MRISTLGILVLSLLVFNQCESKKRVPADAAPVTNGLPEGHPPMSGNDAANGHAIVVKEVLQGDTYTYLLAEEDGTEYWIATAKQPIEKGMELSYGQSLEMRDFTSKEVNKTFDVIQFVSKLSGYADAEAHMGTANTTGGGAQSISVDKVQGGVNVAELYAGAKDFEGKTITIRGEVTKYNPNIMGRNWVHIQDGSQHGASYDVTITTSETVKKGDVVVFSGTVALNKDFGAGYIYDLIVEEAALAKAG